MSSNTQDYSNTRTFSDLLKPLHFFLGLLSFALAIVLSVAQQLGDTNVLLLACFGLINMLFAPVVPSWKCSSKQNLQNIVSVMVLAVALMQAIFVVIKFEGSDGYNASAFSVAVLLAATIIHLMLHYNRQPKKQAATATYETVGEAEGDRELGTVKWFNTAKGFGFISRDSGEDIFVHFRAIRGEGHRVLVEGERVEFYVMERDKGLQAEDVVKL